MAILCCFSLCLSAQEWTEREIARANTAINVDYMNEVEKDIIMYINLARMYPQKFAEVVVAPYNGPKGFSKERGFDAYKKSLLADLSRQQAMQPLQPSESMYDAAYCWAEESGRLGMTGHARVSCPSIEGAECCSYGVYRALDVVLQWLIDANVPSLGHRINCLNPEYNYAGVSQMRHTKWKYCTVWDATY